MRDQEVLRANRELSAYFKGRRTEREARAALRIIKAFVRDREARDARNRPPLPGARAAKIERESTNRKPARAGGARHLRKPRGKSQDKSSKSVSASIESQADPEAPQLSEPADRLPE